MSEVLAGLPSAELLERVRKLVERGNVIEAELLVHLAEVDARQLYLEEGCSSMFTYCQRVLHFAESVAYKRIQAARAARRYPRVDESPFNRWNYPALPCSQSAAGPDGFWRAAHGPVPANWI